MIVQCPDCTTRYQLDADRVPRERIRVRCPKCRYVFGIDGTLAEHDFAAAAVPSGPVPVMPPSGPANSGPAPTIDQMTRGSGSTTRAYGEIDFGSPGPPPATLTDPVVSRPVQPVVSDPPPAAEPVAPAAAPEAPPMPGPELDLEIERTDVGRSAAPATAVTPEPPVATAPAPPSPQARTSGSARAADPQDDKSRRLARALVSDILVYNRETRDKALAEGNLVQALGQEIKKSWEVYKEKVTPEVANSTNHFREALNEILADGQKIF